MTGNDSRPMRPHNPWAETWRCITQGHAYRAGKCKRCGRPLFGTEEAKDG